MAPQTEGVTDFHASKEYLALNDKQRVWVDTFVSTQDAALATQTAYSPATPVYGKLLQYKIEATARIRAALNRYLGRSEQDVFLEEVQETMRRAPKGSDRQVRAQALYARLKYDIKPEVSDPEPAPAPAPQATTPKATAPAVSKLPKPFIGQIVPRRRPDGTSRDVLIVDIDPITGRTQSIDVPTDLSSEQRAALTANVVATAARASALPLVPEPPIARVSTPVATAVPTPKPANPPVVTEGMSGDEIRAAVLRAAENETPRPAAAPTPGTAAWVQQQVDLLHAKPPVAINTEVRGTEAWIIREMEILKGQS